MYLVMPVRRWLQPISLAYLGRKATSNSLAHKDLLQGELIGLLSFVHRAVSLGGRSADTLTIRRL